MLKSETSYFLVIDNGTQSVRAMLFNGCGELLAKNKVDIEPYKSPQPGWAEQDLDYYWQALCEACQGLWRISPVPPGAINAMSVTTQRATLGVLDWDNKPLRPAMVWLDQRRVESKPKLGTLFSVLSRVSGARKLIKDFSDQAEVNWIASEQADIWQKTDKVVLLSGYHHLRLTGQFRDAVASQVGYLPFDFKKQQWAADNDWKWQVLPLKRDMLPELVAAGGTIGSVTAEAALQTGIPEGLSVIASGSDKACEVLGSGCLAPGSASLSYGTTATFNITTRKHLEVKRFHPPYPGIVPGTYNPEVMVKRGYWMVSWFKNEFGLREQQQAELLGVPPESLFDDLLQAVPPGAMGLMLQPYWSAEVGSEQPEAKGAIIGFGAVHNRAHIYRAIIEGLTYALREGKEKMVKCSGQKINLLRVSGGGSQSDQIMQITADIFGMAVQRPKIFEASGLGAAIATAVGCGLYTDFDTAVAEMVQEGDVFQPIAKHQKMYDQLYNKVYRRMYRALQPGYRAIRAITRYPD